jgi:hypothetical protein
MRCPLFLIALTLTVPPSAAAQTRADTIALLDLIAQSVLRRGEQQGIGHRPELSFGDSLEALEPLARERLGSLCVPGDGAAAYVEVAGLHIGVFHLLSDTAWVNYSASTRDTKIGGIWGSIEEWKLIRRGTSDWIRVGGSIGNSDGELGSGSLPPLPPCTLGPAD